MSRTEGCQGKPSICVLTHVFPFGGEWFLVDEARALEIHFPGKVTWYPRIESPGPQIASFALNATSQRARFMIRLFWGVALFPIAAFVSEIKVLWKRGRPSDFINLLLASVDGGYRLHQILKGPRFDIYYSYWSSVDGLAAARAAKISGSK